MTNKTKNIVSIVVGALPAAMVLMSAIMKLTANPQLVASMSKGGFGPYIPAFGAIEIISLILFFVPKTKKIGFYLLCSYLGGACAVELSMGSHMPVSAILLTLFWVSMFINNKENFLPVSTKSNN
jgi:hypothetical protein